MCNNGRKIMCGPVYEIKSTRSKQRRQDELKYIVKNTGVVKGYLKIYKNVLPWWKHLEFLNGVHMAGGGRAIFLVICAKF